MSDLISREALKAIVERHMDMQDLYLPAHFLDLADDLPTVDAVEVVRCVKCKHSYETILGPGCEPLCGLVCTKGPCVDCIVPEDFYCPYGERKENENVRVTD